ncbi:MAG: hypothetical protein HUU28_08575 [Planctomycetaceae bacterium]|nr:hypothetical protein [Planctomycetaceae bacterium]
MKPLTLLVPFVLSFPSCALARPQVAVAAATQERALPVREVTVFKDGHAYVLREQEAPQGGEVVLTELPVPVLGTFWPYATGGARLVHAKSGYVESERDVDAIDLQQLVEANVGRKARIKDATGEEFSGVLRPLPRRSDSDSNASVVVLEGEAGSRALQLHGVRWIEIEGQPARTIRAKTRSERLTLKLDSVTKDSKVGVVYVQEGLRWVPSYKLDIDGNGKARVQMEASLQNDLIDLKDATVNLVVGVPSFEFKDLVDPIALQQELARVSAAMDFGQNFSNVLSNSLRTQVAGYAPRQGDAPAETVPAGSEAAEDLYVFTVKHVTLAKGERMVLPLREFELSYRDVYTLEVPFSPPLELREQLQSERVMELAKALAAPKVMHVLRLKNTSDAPLTTAPALVLSRGRVLAQGQMRYTPTGVETDLEINPAIEVCVELEEREAGRTPNAERWNGNNYGRIDIAGAITLRNEKGQAVELEVRRRVLGVADSVGQEGALKQLDLASLGAEVRGVSWWGWWNWPYWWFRFNGFAEFRWKAKLEPGESVKFDAGWHYFWQ